MVRKMQTEQTGYTEMAIHLHMQYILDYIGCNKGLYIFHHPSSFHYPNIKYSYIG